ncbi:PAS domain-containing protein [Mucilaginibacter terrae]|uniref:PAS domain-containing protein n=1 Tax=Mucilaginibacter terrae TaxID=1955052 RepID=UPI00363F59D7
MERFLNLNVSRENELQNIVTLAAEACQTRAAFLVFLDEGKLKHQFRYGFVADVIPKDMSFWNIDLQDTQVRIINDLTKSTEFAQHPLVLSAPHLRFYAGVPLITHDKQNIGSLYVLGQEAKILSERRKNMLHLLSQQAVNMIEFESSLKILKEQFAEAKNSENKLRSFFESSKSSHLLIGLNMEVITFNKTFRDISFAIFGREIVAGVNAVDFIYGSYVDDFIRHVKTALNGETVQHERLVKFDGLEPRWAKITYNPTYNGEGRIIGVSFNSTDITERKRNEEKIISQNQALRKIAYLQSHELRKPVASILGLMHLLKLEETGPKSQILQMMEKAVLELDETIHHIVKSTETQTEQDPFPENYTF